LIGIRFDVDDRLHLPMPFVNGTRPPHGKRHFQAVETALPEVSLVDPEEADRPAGAVCRQRVELAGAGISAVAVAEFKSVKLPISHS
jgi:hypothetical protein